MTSITHAITILRQGGLVAFPTETVYGLGADANNPLALKKIFAAKGRPEDHPLIVHIADVTQLVDFAREIPESVYALAKHFWPGPLTLILKKASSVSALVTGGQDTVGIRIPCHPVAKALLQAFQGGLAAPSANRFGRISPTSAQAVREELADAVDIVLEGGDCEVGLESTILDLSSRIPQILRPGMITLGAIEAVLNTKISLAADDAPRVSGSLPSHYAPETKTIMLSREEILARLPAINFPTALLVREPFSYESNAIKIVMMPFAATDYAHDLYHTLRDLDKRGFKQLIIEEPPQGLEWDAIRDRLQRAANRI